MQVNTDFVSKTYVTGLIILFKAFPFLNKKNNEEYFKKIQQPVIKRVEYSGCYKNS